MEYGARCRTTLEYCHRLFPDPASGLSFCLARSSFWHIDRRAGHSDLQVYLQDQSSQASDHVRSAQGRPSFVGISSFLHASSLRTNINHYIPGNYIFITTYARFTAFLALLSALLFVICFATLSVGLTISPQMPEEGTIQRMRDEATCMALIYICIGLYAITRIFVYMFFVERVYLVRCGGINVPRLSTTTYRGALFGFAIYLAIMIILVVGRTAKLQPPADHEEGSTQSCIIGIHLYGLIPFFLFDLLFSSILTIAFVVSILNQDKNDEDRRKLSIPMFLTKRRKQADAPAQDWAPQPTEQPGSISGIPPERSGQSNPAPTVAETEDFVSWQDIVFESSHSSLRKLAIRSLIASLIGLIASCVNVAVWIAYRGRRESMTCMRWCFVDVTINAFVVAALVQGRGDETWWQNELRQQQTSVRFAPSNEDSSPLGEGTERGRAVVSPKCLASSTLPSTSPRPQVVCLPLAPNPQTFEFTPEHDIDNPGDNKGLVQEPNRHQSTAPCQMRRSLQFPSAARSVDSRRWSSTE